MIKQFGRPATTVIGRCSTSGREMAEDFLAETYFKTLFEALPPIPPCWLSPLGCQAETVLFENASAQRRPCTCKAHMISGRPEFYMSNLK